MTPGGLYYEIWVEEILESRWLQWFPEMEIVSADERNCPVTMLRGRLADQAALFGLLGRIRDLNLTLIMVRRTGED